MRPSREMTRKGSGEVSTAVQAILFDVGGVLVTQRMSPVIVAEILGLDTDNPFEVSAVDRAIWAHRDQHDEGISDAEFWNIITLDLGVHEPSEQQLSALVHQDVVRMNHADPAALALTDMLLAAGYELGLLANSPVSVAEEVRRSAWAKDRFTTFVFSGDHRQRKPQSSIYRTAAEQIGRSPEEILFIDDRPKHVRTAQYLGMQGLVWESVEQATNELCELGYISL